MAQTGTSTEDRAAAGLILAGGRGRRMGGTDKPFALLDGRPLVGHVIERAGRQVSRLAVSAAGDAARFGSFGLPVLADPAGLEAYSGPLAGILAGLDWAAALPALGVGALAIFPADTPFFPEDFVERGLAALRDGTEVAVAASGGRLHPTVAVWGAGLGGRLRRLLVEDGLRRADRIPEHFRVATIDYGADPVDPFFNVNTPGDLAAAERLFR
ncbi:MAG: molybdenum cofactor guanylyltransferase MobA [Rhodospirillales bacterium]|nr:molybdenum cofactor guanylyltransferase MobA [Rhodospirillales bacterium]